MINQLKSMTLEIFAQLAEVETEDIPSIYCLNRLPAALNAAGASPLEKDRIMEGIRLEITGLGMRAKGHEEFLDELVTLTAKTYLRFYRAVRAKHGDPVACSFISSMPLKVG